MPATRGGGTADCRDADACGADVHGGGAEPSDAAGDDADVRDGGAEPSDAAADDTADGATTVGCAPDSDEDESGRGWLICVSMRAAAS